MRAFGWAATAIVSIGCGGEAKPEPGPEQLSAASAAPNATLDERLDSLATEFLPNMKAAGPAFHGQLEEGERQDFQAVLQTGRCYKILAVGPRDADLDMYLFDQEGVQTQQDTGTDEYPILGYTHAICPRLSGTYRVQILMSRGAGDFRARVYQSL